MNDEQRLREALAEAVPPSPPGAGRGPRARAAADRTRRTRTRLAVAGAAAAVALAVAVPTLWAGGDGSAPAPSAGSSGPSGSPTSGSSEPVDVTCPPPGSEPHPTGPDSIGEGAVTARLCPVGGITWQAPPDALTTGLDELVGVVRGLEPDTVAAGQEVCPLDLGRSFAVVLGYPDGRTQTATGELFGCRLLRVGGARYVEADRVWDTYLRLLRAQRAASPPPPPAAPTDLSCDTRIDTGPGNGVIGGPADLTYGLYCWRPETLTDQRWSSAMLTAGQLARLTAALTDPANLAPASDACGGGPRVQEGLVGYDAWGDRIAVDGECGVFYVDDHQVRLPHGVRAMLEGLRRDQPSQVTPPGPGAAPDVVVEAWADLLGNGQRGDADALWVDPAAAIAHSRVDLKVEESAPLDPGADPATSAYASAQRVTALFRVSPPDGSWVDYHEQAFTLVRSSGTDPWRILSTRDLGAVSTGR